MNEAKLDAVQVETAEQVQALREIRNLSRGSFSHDNSPITELAQRAWWVVQRGRIRAWLYLLGGDLVGYGLVRQDSRDRWWNSLAVLPLYRGRGFGSAITADLLERHEGPIYASVRRDNFAGLAMHHAADWECIDGPDENLIYFRSYARGGIVA